VKKQEGKKKRQFYSGRAAGGLLREVKVVFDRPTSLYASAADSPIK